jgi:hypothetical protein
MGAVCHRHLVLFVLVLLFRFSFRFFGFLSLLSFCFSLSLSEEATALMDSKPDVNRPANFLREPYQIAIGPVQFRSWKEIEDLSVVTK